MDDVTKMPPGVAHILDDFKNVMPPKWSEKLPPKSDLDQKIEPVPQARSPTMTLYHDTSEDRGFKEATQGSTLVVARGQFELKIDPEPTQSWSNPELDLNRPGIVRGWFHHSMELELEPAWN